jgi:hypothetical protein
VTGPAPGGPRPGNLSLGSHFRQWRRCEDSLADLLLALTEVLDSFDRLLAGPAGRGVRLAGLDPTNTGWQRDLAVAHGRVGGVAQARGDLAAAERAFAQDLAISERLAAEHPDTLAARERLDDIRRRLGQAPDR